MSPPGNITAVGNWEIWKNITFVKHGRVWINDLSYKLFKLLFITISDSMLQTAKNTCCRALAISSIPSRKEMYELNDTAL